MKIQYISFILLFTICSLSAVAQNNTILPEHIKAFNIADTAGRNFFIKINPNFAAVFDFIDRHDLSEMAVGRHEVYGEKVYLSISEGALRSPEQANLEVHNKYIDIQIPLTANEIFGYIPRSECKLPRSEFNTTKDVQLFNDELSVFITVHSGEYIVFFPDDAHSPMRGEGHIKKATFKVSVKTFE